MEFHYFLGPLSLRLMFCFLGGNSPAQTTYKLKDETDWTQPKAVENFLKILEENHRTKIMNHYSNMSNSWEKIATMLTEVWFTCPNLEVGEKLKNEMSEGGNIYFYRLSSADNTLGIVVF